MPIPMPRRRSKTGSASPITTHVLDTALGRPAVGLAVQLEVRGAGGRFKSLARGATDANGRITDLWAGGRLRPGVYRLTFATAAYFRQSKLAAEPQSTHRSKATQGFYPSVSVLFEVRDPLQHYHVPLLLSPFGYSTYRGS